MLQEVMLGNEAIGRGLVEAGCHVVTSYPGTPSSEILPAVIHFKNALGLDTYVEWSTNEKIAMEVALAASWAGKRAAVAMKQVGLNVASDPLLSAAYTGVVGGFVVIAADDPGPHSSQTEQDTRLFALFAKVPVLDPSSPREAKAMVKAAFELSEKHRTPVILRPAIRVCHAKQNVLFDPVEPVKRKAAFKKEPARWAATPGARLALHKELNGKLAQIEAEFETSPFNLEIGDWRLRTRIGDPTNLEWPISNLQSLGLGIIAAGVCYLTVVEILEEAGLAERVSVLKIGTPYPLPRRLVADFMAAHERVLVLEEPDAAIEFQIADRRNVLGRLDGTVPQAGELTPDVIFHVLGNVISEAGIANLTPAWDDELAGVMQGLGLTVRKPRLCPGCPHRSAFFAMKRTFPSAVFPSDIGCYTLGLNLRAVDTVLDMGAAITIATGLYQAYRLDNVDQPILASIGDSTFLHSGIPALANAVHTNARFILVILDNSTTAMTGFQPTAQDSVLADHQTGQQVSIEALVRACGVRFVEGIDPYQIDEMKGLLQRAQAYTRSPEGGVAVIIARRPCVLYDPTPVSENPVKVEILEECDGCKYCLAAFECPALVLNPAIKKVEIDRRVCVDCGQCVDSCYKGLIVPVMSAA